MPVSVAPVRGPPSRLLPPKPRGSGRLMAAAAAAA
eukprot:CAMPEP_0172793882 /NCGR_PEP_ID=MMETSP1074-20121228/209702_1 /TAXON_ID=2916 /ORGANISM="Ceratium fusus, Strain PA161109" /LENGTH=34 /DNA_ID= /DNA_START= /DNA_END= /DNA_ORIENTATION=